MIKNSETFLEFYTYFLYLIEGGQILDDDLHPDLYDKLTLDLQWIIVPIEESLTALSDF